MPVSPVSSISPSSSFPSSALSRRALIAAACLAAQRSVRASAQPTLLPHLPSIGLGTCCDEAERVQEQVTLALSQGYRLIDTASHYPGEEAIGAALDAAEASGVVARSEVTVCTKVWFDDMGYEAALSSAVRSMRRLRTEQLDLLLIHFPGTIDAVQEPKRNRKLREETWRALERLQADGRVLKIGVSNWTSRHLRETLASCQVTPQVLQTEVHPRLQQEALVADAMAAGMEVMAFCPLAHGSPRLLQDPVVRQIAAARGRSSAQVLLRWSMQHGLVPIPKSTSLVRLRENIGAMNFELSAAEMASLDGLEANDRCSFDPRNIA
ncbi:hypothetical protein AB1Y20_023211 [Prymnesium parvum]|uniref:NADP-dependent oxidoreductase domain-containing protein n=1 Tax=Prymnesium parvum TaxID=97485 RepID=A0AB34JDX8_PRYPA